MFCLFVVHCGSIRQTASILSMSRTCLRTGDKALVRFRFIKHPEYLRRGQRMVYYSTLTRPSLIIIISITRARIIQHHMRYSANSRRTLLYLLVFNKQGGILDKVFPRMHLTLIFTEWMCLISRKIHYAL